MDRGARETVKRPTSATPRPTCHARNTWVPEFVALNSLAALDSFATASKEIRRERFLLRDLEDQRRQRQDLRHPVVRRHSAHLLPLRHLAKAGIRNSEDVGGLDDAMKKIKSQMSPTVSDSECPPTSGPSR